MRISSGNWGERKGFPPLRGDAPLWGAAARATTPEPATQMGRQFAGTQPTAQACLSQDGRNCICRADPSFRKNTPNSCINTSIARI